MVALFKMPRPLAAFAGAPATTPQSATSKGGTAKTTEPRGALAAEVLGSIRPAPTGAERRMFTRKEIHCRVQGKRLDHAVPALQEPQLSLSLRDLSLGGLSAISERPVALGERVAVFFPPQGPNLGWDAFGRVLRCDRGAVGFRIAVEFDPLPAA